MGSTGVAVAIEVVIMALIMARGTAALGQQSRNLDLPRFEPTPAGDRFLGVPSAPEATASGTALRAGALLDYARNPLIISDSDGHTLGRVVAHQMLLHLDLALALGSRVGLDVDVPFALVNRGDGTFEAGTFTGANAFASPAGNGGVGDARLGGRVRLLGGRPGAAAGTPLRLFAGGYLWVPTATRNDFLTDGKVRAEGHLAADGRWDRLVFAAVAGVTWRSAQTYGAIPVGSQLMWGGAVGVLLGRRRATQLGVETIGGLTLSSSAHPTNGEALAEAKLQAVDWLELGIGAGKGFSIGLGTPDYRALLRLGLAPPAGRRPVVASTAERDRDGDGIQDRVDACPDTRGVATGDAASNGCPAKLFDRDGDGIVDGLDACPTEAGPARDDAAKNGCPSRDADGDGIADDADACPKEAGPANDDAKKNGCPPPADADGDGIADLEDACPQRPGVKSADPGTNGCPADSDGDGIRDDEDACPHEKGVEDADRTRRGCPRLVRVTANEIVILEQVQFATNKSTIKPASDALLTSVAEVMQEHPEILTIEVQGHTDARGKKKRNARLSQDRANAVVKALVGHGIDSARLAAKGFGQDLPIASNASEEGRQKNRRVQFIVTRRSKGAGEEAVVPAGTTPPDAPREEISKPTSAAERGDRSVRTKP